MKATTILSILAFLCTAYLSSAQISFSTKAETDKILDLLNKDQKRQLIYNIKKEYPQYISKIDNKEVYFFNTFFVGIHNKPEMTIMDSIKYYFSRPLMVNRYMFVEKEKGVLDLLCIFELIYKKGCNPGVPTFVALPENADAVCEVFYNRVINLVKDKGPNQSYTIELTKMVQFLIDNNYELDKVGVFDIMECFRMKEGMFVRYKKELFTWNDNKLTEYHIEKVKNCSLTIE